MTFIIHKQEWKHADGTSATTYHVMEIHGRGFVEAYLDDKGLEIGNLSVDNEYRMQGMATKMLGMLENYISKFQYLLDNNRVYVEIEPDAPVWLYRFYRKRGYVVGVRDYETNRDDERSEEFAKGFEAGKKYEREHPNTPYSITEVRHNSDFQGLPKNTPVETVNQEELHNQILDPKKIYYCEGCNPSYDEWISAGLQLGYDKEFLDYDNYLFLKGDMDYTR